MPKLYKEGIVRDVSNQNRILEMKKKGWQVLGSDGKIIPSTSDDSGSKIAELESLVEKQVKELNALKAQSEAQHDSSETVEECLKQYAEVKKIDTGSASSASGILAKILEAEKA